jgi:hypothetical protein
MQANLAEYFIPTYIPERTKSLRLHFKFEDNRQKMTNKEFSEFCSNYLNLNAELTKEGDILITFNKIFA